MEESHYPEMVSLRLLGLFLFLSLSACATSDYDYMPDSSGGNTATGAAWTADSMHFRKRMPTGRGTEPMEFYYKHCSEIGEEVFYSKTSYDCTLP